MNRSWGWMPETTRATSTTAASTRGSRRTRADVRAWGGLGMLGDGRCLPVWGLPRRARPDRCRAPSSGSQNVALAWGMSEVARVLVVDDEPAVREALQRAWPSRATRRTGRRRAGRAGEAGAARRTTWSCSTSMMPRMDGLTAGRRLRAAGQPRARPDAHRPRHRRRPGHRAWTRAPTTTWSSRSSWTSCSPGSAPCCGAAALSRRRAPHGRRRAGLRRPADGPGHPRGHPGRAARGADPHRVHAAGDVPGPPAPGAHPRADPQAGVGLRLRAVLQLPRRVRDVPAPQDRGRRRAPAGPHRARGRLRAARGAT